MTPFLYHVWPSLLWQWNCVLLPLLRNCIQETTRHVQSMDHRRIPNPLVPNRNWSKLSCLLYLEILRWKWDSWTLPKAKMSHVWMLTTIEKSCFRQVFRFDRKCSGPIWKCLEPRQITLVRMPNRTWYVHRRITVTADVHDQIIRSRITGFFSTLRLNLSGH